MAEVIDWLRADRAAPSIDLGGRRLPVELKVLDRARRLTLRLAADGSAVRITVPRWCRTRDALAFAQAKAQWLEAQLAALPPPVDPVARGTLRYRGAQLAIRWSPQAPRRIVLGDAAIALGGPHDRLGPRLRRWLEAEAQRFIAADLAAYCEAAAVPVPGLRLTRATRRWGSCSSTGVVRISWRLIMAPDFVRRSVVAHEVAHLVHFNHSPAFHALLATLFEGEIAEADAWLREHGRALQAEFA